MFKLNGIFSFQEFFYLNSDDKTIKLPYLVERKHVDGFFQSESLKQEYLTFEHIILL